LIATYIFTVLTSITATYIFTAPTCTTTIITLELCALNGEFQHFILRFNEISLLCGYHRKQCFFSIFLMWHKWRSSHKRFGLSDSDPTEGLALMAKILKKTVRTVKTGRKNCLTQSKSDKNSFVTACNLAP
jgi:hypothetical protein